MKKFFLMITVLLQGCFWGTSFFAPVDVCIFNGSRENLIDPERTTLNVYWELGEVQLLGDGLQIYKPNKFSESVVNAINNEVPESLALSRFCPKYRAYGALIGERIFNPNGDESSLNAECLYEMRSLRQDDFESMEAFFWYAFRRTFMTNIVDGQFHAYYIGDRISTVQDSNFVHRKLNDEEKSSICAEYIRRSINPDYAKKEGCPEYAYELVFPLDVPVYSITVQNNPGWGYKPLKLDPSILPLESPGYKKLREYEESLGKRF